MNSGPRSGCLFYLELLLLLTLVACIGSRAQAQQSVQPGYQICSSASGTTQCSFQPVDATHPLPVTAAGAGGIAGTVSNAGSAVAPTSTNAPVVNYNYSWNGSGWDQSRGLIVGTPAVPSGDVLTTTGSPLTPSTTGALAANQIIKGAAGNLYSFQVSADVTLSAAAWWVMIYDATAAPADGAVTPKKCFAMPLGTTQYSKEYVTPIVFTVGVVIGVSTTGCFTKTASVHAFISGDAQ